MSTQISKVATEYQIVQGHAPGKWDLSMGLLESTCQQPRFVTFKVQERRFPDGKMMLTGPVLVVSVLLCSVDREDGSGESFLFKGYVNHKGSSPQIKEPIRNVAGYFRTDRRTGHLTLS